MPPKAPSLPCVPTAEHAPLPLWLPEDSPSCCKFCSFALQMVRLLCKCYACKCNPVARWQPSRRHQRVQHIAKLGWRSRRLIAVNTAIGGSGWTTGLTGCKYWVQQTGPLALPRRRRRKSQRAHHSRSRAG